MPVPPAAHVAPDARAASALPDTPTSRGARVPVRVILAAVVALMLTAAGLAAVVDECTGDDPAGFCEGTTAVWEVAGSLTGPGT